MTDYAISWAWRRNDAMFEKDAIDFWRRTKILPAGISPEARAKELCAVAYEGETLVGVATTSLEDLPLLRARFAMFRCAVSPEHRRSHLANDLTVFTRPLIEQWSLEHPEERVKGMGLVLEADLGDKGRQPLWPTTGLNLVGYSAHNKQLRVAWFAHARVD